MRDTSSVGILTSGGDAPGMNSAVRAAFRAIYRGPFTADLTQPISYHTTVTKEEAVQ